jgi:hypothetical protein
MNEVGAEMKGLAGEWRRLTESGASGADWTEWYDLTDRCEKWRRGPTARSFYSKGRDSTTAPHTSSEVTGSPIS